MSSYLRSQQHTDVKWNIEPVKPAAAGMSGLRAAWRHTPGSKTSVHPCGTPARPPPWVRMPCWSKGADFHSGAQGTGGGDTTDYVCKLVWSSNRPVERAIPMTLRNFQFFKIAPIERFCLFNVKKEALFLSF